MGDLRNSENLAFLSVLPQRNDQSNVIHVSINQPGKVNNDNAKAVVDVAPGCGVFTSTVTGCPAPAGRVVTLGGVVNNSLDSQPNALWHYDLDSNVRSRVPVPAPASNPNSKNSYTEITKDASVILGMNSVTGPRMWYWSCRGTCAGPTTPPTFAQDGGICPQGAGGQYCDFNFRSMPRTGGTTQLTAVEAMSNRGQVVGGNGYDPVLVTPITLFESGFNDRLPLCP